jgi:hypothetical protein
MSPVWRTAWIGLVIIAASAGGGWSSGHAVGAAIAGAIGVLVAVAIVAYANRGHADQQPSGRPPT